MFKIFNVWGGFYQNILIIILNTIKNQNLMYDRVLIYRCILKTLETGNDNLFFSLSHP